MSYEVTITLVYKGVAETSEQVQKLAKGIEEQAKKAGLIEATITADVNNEKKTNLRG